MKIEVKNSIIVALLFVGIMMPLVFNITKVNADISPDPDSIGERLVIYSETALGDSVNTTMYQWNWDGDMSISETDVNPAEGNSSTTVTTQNVAGWWGLGFAPASPYNLSKFLDGFLIVSIKSDYNGTFHIGFNSGTQPSTQDAFLELFPGEYGYNNDSIWHKVIIPVSDIWDVNPSVDLEDVEEGVFVLFDDSTIGDGYTTNGTITFDDVYYQVGPNKVIFSETTTGDSIEYMTVWNNWVGTVTITEDVNITAAEGENCTKVIPSDLANWWGMGVEAIPKVDLSDYAGGLLIFSINTTYNGNLTVGFQTGTYGYDHADLQLVISPGDFGYQNDGKWHQVTIPLDDTVQVNTSIGDLNLEEVANVFVLLFSGSIDDGVPIYLDNIYWQAAVKPLIPNIAPTVSNVNLTVNATSGDLVLSYNYSDPEGDSDQSQIIWYKNNVEMSTYENLTVVPSADLAVNDEWYAEITPFDGKDANATITTNIVVIEPDDGEDGGGIPGFPISAFLSITVIALILSIRKYKN